MPELPPYLLFLGPLRPSASSNAERIAGLVADNASDNLHGTYRVTKMPAATEFAGRDGAAVVDPDGEVVLYVVDVPFHRELGMDESGLPAGRSALLRNLYESLRFFVLAVVRLLAARSQQAKSTRAKWQLAIGLGFVFVLALVAVLGALALIAAIWPQALPDFLTNEDAGPRVGVGVFGGTVTLGTVYALARGRVSLAGRLAQRLLGYAEDAQERKEIANVLALAVDSIDDLSPADGPRPVFHVLGYSFGSILALDALRPPAGSAPRPKLAQVASLATVGCPADFVRLYYPDFYDGRVDSSLVWHNVFIGSDVLGSNFLDTPSDGATTASEEYVPANGLRPTENHGFGVGTLSVRALFRREGFSMHARYWDDAYRTSVIDVLMPLWPPMAPAQD